MRSTARRCWPAPAATVQRFTAPGLSGFSFQALTPADLDGTTRRRPARPASSCAIATPRSTARPAPRNDFLEMWEFHVDWTTPANSTFTKLPNI